MGQSRKWISLRRRTWAALLVLALAAACSRGREYELRGQILAVDTARSEITIKHEDIKGFMPGMTMPFKVKDAALLEGRAPGDLIRATLVVEDAQGYLEGDRTDGTRAGHRTSGRAPARRHARAGRRGARRGARRRDRRDRAG